MELRPLHNVLVNLFLALVPVLLSFGIARGIRGQWRAQGRVAWGLWTPLLLVWLAFLPNTCYLLTEWRHYLETITQTQLFFRAEQSRDGVFDLITETGFYVFYSGSGLLTFFLAVWPLERLARRRLGWWAWPAKAGVFTLCALGVFLGLLPRLNTWNLLPAQGLLRVLHTARDVVARPVLMGLVLGFGAILWVLYSLFDIWMDGAAWRLRVRRERRSPRPGASLPGDTVAGDPASEEGVWHHASL